MTRNKNTFSVKGVPSVEYIDQKATIETTFSRKLESTFYTKGRGKSLFDDIFSNRFQLCPWNESTNDIVASW